jgi:hypothetical protein
LSWHNPTMQLMVRSLGFFVVHSVQQFWCGWPWWVAERRVCNAQIISVTIGTCNNCLLWTHGMFLGRFQIGVPFVTQSGPYLQGRSVCTRGEMLFHQLYAVQTNH